MGLEQSPYADVAEVRNVGRRRANIYLANGWTLLGWEMEQRIARRDGPPDEAGVPQPMHIKLAEILYILGRSEDVDFEGNDIHQYERDENRARREQETERAAQAVDEGSAVETRGAPQVGKALAKFRRDFDAASRGEPPPEENCEHEWVNVFRPCEDLDTGRSCGKCGAPEPPERVWVPVAGPFSADPRTLYRHIEALIMASGEYGAEDCKIAIDQQAWHELSDLWPRAYYLGRSAAFGTGVLSEADRLRLRNEMRDGAFLLFDAVQVPVSLSGIAEGAAGPTETVDRTVSS